MMVIIWLMMVINNLVGGWPTPLKNHGVRQLGWWHSQYMESHKINVPNHQPEKEWTSDLSRLVKIFFCPLFSGSRFNYSVQKFNYSYPRAAKQAQIECSRIVSKSFPCAKNCSSLMIFDKQGHRDGSEQKRTNPEVNHHCLPSRIKKAVKKYTSFLRILKCD